MSATGSGELDLSNLLFSSSISSKLQYFTLLFSSCASISISFARILTFGGQPMVTSLLSANFLKTVLFLLTKFLVLAYLLSMSIRSMMMYYVFGSENELFTNILEYNYRGLCRKTGDKKHNEEYFCRRAANLSFNTATIYIPIIGLVLLYLPSLIYITVIIIKKKNRQMLNFYCGFIFVIFSIVTNVSVFGENFLKGYGNNEIRRYPSSSKVSLPRRFSLDLKSNTPEPGSQKKTTRSKSMPTLVHASSPLAQVQDYPDHNDTGNICSLYQSNVLYSLFMVSAVVFLFVDILLQYLRQRDGGIASITLAVLSCLLINKALWVNFIWHLRQSSNNR